MPEMDESFDVVLQIIDWVGSICSISRRDPLTPNLQRSKIFDADYKRPEI